MALSAGDRIGPYEIVGPIGTGGMGEVFKARDERLARFVALKILHTPTATDAALRDRFQREARAVAALSHPNIVTIFSIEEHDGSPFMTMELLEGQTLTELLPPRGASLITFLQIAIPLADAVAAAHARGIMHRDLKPGNVMVTVEGHLKVLDFGLAKLTETPAVASEFTSVATEQLTGHGQILGTVAYMSPEQAEGKTIDHRSDIFSLGIVLYELATGRKPFTGETNVALLSSILRDTPPLVSDVNPAIPGEVARLIRRCLEKSPSQRLQSCLDLKHELEDVRSALSASHAASRSTTSLVPEAAPGRSRLMLASLALAIVVVAGAGRLVWTRWLTVATESTDVTISNGAPITVTRFENRTGEAALDPVGQMLVDALSQELPRLRNIMQASGAGEVPVNPAPASGAPHGTVAGAYYFDGENVRIQATLATDAGEVLYSIEPATGPRADPGKAVDLAQQRILGAIVSWLDPNLGRAQLQRPPIFSAYREFKTGMSVFADDPAKAIDHFSRAIELDPGFFSPWYGKVLSYNNLGDPRAARETLVRMRAVNDRWGTKERALLAFLTESIDGRLLDGLQALRAAEKVDPTDLSTNYLIGYYLVRLNRPQEAIDQYAKVDAASWNSVTVGTWRFARLATANHLLGRHDEELRVATVARGLFPTSFLSRNDVIAALAALGRIDDLRKALDDTQTIPMRGTSTPAESMRVAAEELRAHGRRAESIEMARRAAGWIRNRPPEYLTAPANRLSLAQSLYVAEEWTEAGVIASRLLREQPESVPYLALAGAVAARAGDRNAAMTFAASLAKATSGPGGLTELRRAQLAALLGQREQAVELLRDAFARGLSMSLTLHRQMDLESLRGFAPYDELMKPRG